MEFNQYVTDAIRTESKIDEIVVNELLLTSTIQVLIAMGNILDQIKKHAFYKKPYDLGALRTHMEVAYESMVTLGTLHDAEILNDERTIPVDTRIFHSVVGIATESTELLEAMDLYDPNLDYTNLLEEFGDIDWYKAIGVDTIGGDWEDILTKNIAKLKARFPDKFTSEDAIHRDLSTERKILDTMKQGDQSE